MNLLSDGATQKSLTYYCSFALSAALVGPWIAPRNGVVIASSPQLLVGAAGYAVARTRRQPFVFEVRDLWPQSLEAVGAAPPSSIFYRSLERLAKFLYQRADRVVVDGEWKRCTLAAAGVQPEKIVVIRNGVAEDFCLEPESASAAPRCSRAVATGGAHFSQITQRC